MFAAASMCLLASCDKQPLTTPQNSYAVTFEQAQQVAERLTNTTVGPDAAKLKTISKYFVLTAEQKPALYVFNYQESRFSIISADQHPNTSRDYSGWFTYDNWYIKEKSVNYQYVNDMVEDIYS